MKIYFITSNKGKFEFAKKRLKDLPIELIQKELNIEESRDITVEDVVLNKAKQAEKIIKDPFIIEDTGFCIKSLKNFPATHIKFTLNTIGIKGILKLLEGEEKRDVKLKSALIFYNKNKRKMFICEDKGIVSKNIRGNDLRGFNDLMKIFIPINSKKTVAEMSDKEFLEYEKNIEKYDHYIKLKDYIKKLKNEQN